jgi:hypothetical protein
MTENKKIKGMGFICHPVTSSSTIMPRKSRWTLTNTDHPNILWWMKSVKTDYVNKKIKIEIYDDAKGDVFNWTQSLLIAPKSHGPLVLTHLDGCGEVIAFLEFSGLTVNEHYTDYEYGMSDVLMHTLIINYQKVKRHNEIKSENSKN